MVLTGFQILFFFTEPLILILALIVGFKARMDLIGVSEPLPAELLAASMVTHLF